MREFILPADFPSHRATRDTAGGGGRRHSQPSRPSPCSAPWPPPGPSRRPGLRSRCSSSRAQPSIGRWGSPPARTALSGSRTTSAVRSGGSRSTGRSPPTPTLASATPWASRPARMAPCGSRTTRARSDASRRTGGQHLRRLEHHRSSASDRCRPRRCPLARRSRRLDRPHHRRRHHQQVHRPEAPVPRRHRGRGRCALVHRLHRRLDRPSHDPASGARATRDRRPAGSGGGDRDPLRHTNDGARFRSRRPKCVVDACPASVQLGSPDIRRRRGAREARARFGAGSTSSCSTPSARRESAVRRRSPFARERV
jgi:hypothetical protein